jgi:RNA polymerase sigma factor for flagellar operon FliA
MTRKGDIERHLPFVRRVAARIKSVLGPPLALDDLVSYGVLGLDDALEKYEPEQGVAFESFAYYRIRGAILEGISRQCPLTRHEYRGLRLRQKANDLAEGAARDLAAAEGRTPAADASMMATTVRDLSTIYAVAHLVRTGGEEGPRTDFEDPVAAGEHERRVSRAEVRRFLEKLPPEQARLLMLYYFEDMTLDEAGRLMGFKKSWACKLHRAALARMRELMTAEPD